MYFLVFPNYCATTSTSGLPLKKFTDLENAFYLFTLLNRLHFVLPTEVAY